MMELICNEEVTIRHGNKSKTFKNYLLTNFLNKFAENNFASGVNFGMTTLYAIFSEEELEINERTYFEAPDFDDIQDIVPLNAYKDGATIKVINTTATVEKNKGEIDYTYRYKLYGLDNPKLKEQNQDYYGQRIGYLLFGTPSEIYAILDVRDEEIDYEIDTSIDIFRKDYIITTGVFKSDNLEFPYHLLCIPEIYDGITVTQRIESIGLGYSDDLAIQELPIERLRTKVYKNNVYIMTDFDEIDTKNSLFPSLVKQPNSGRYPMRYLRYEVDDNNSLFPHTTNYADDDEYPMEYTPTLINRKPSKYSLHPKKRLRVGKYHPMVSKGNYKYVIIKYRLVNLSNNQDLDAYYTMSYHLTRKGKFKINLKYERRDA